MKTCQKCLNNKHESQFPFRNKAKGTLHTMCKPCHREYAKSHYQANTQMYKAKARRNGAIYAAINKEYVDNLKRNAGCKYCKENEPVALDFHHLSNKSDNIAHMINGSTLISIKREISKCVIMCSNCHRKWHAGLIK